MTVPCQYRSKSQRLPACIMEQCRKMLQCIQKKGIQTYFPKVVKSFRNVATQTNNNIAINILNSKKVHPEDMNMLELDHIEDHKYSIGPSPKYRCKSHLANAKTISRTKLEPSNSRDR